MKISIRRMLLSTLLLVATFSSLAITSHPLALGSNANTQQANTTSIPALIPAPPQLTAKSYIVMDTKSGKILAQKNITTHFPPASLTKMMTLYLVFQALQSGQIHLTDQVRVSHKAWSMTGSRMFLRNGSQVSVEDLIRGIVVASGNDACVAIAQFIGGTEATFADLMNQTAARLNMKNSHFVDSTGLPNPKHFSSAEDMARLAQALIRDFPEYYHFFGQKWIKYNKIKQPNRNRLLWRDPSVDGLKTGHTNEAGYCLVASGERNGMRLITVVLGTPSDSARANNTQALLNYGFRFYKTYKLFDAGKPIASPRIWLGKKKIINLGLKKPLYITIPATEYKDLKASLSLNGRLTAPIFSGNQYGAVTVSLHDKVIAQVPLIALQHDPQGGLFSRLRDHVMMFFKG